MVAAGKKRVEVLQARGFKNASLYGENLVGGLGRLYVLIEKPQAYGLPAYPKYPYSCHPLAGSRSSPGQGRDGRNDSGCPGGLGDYSPQHQNGGCGMNEQDTNNGSRLSDSLDPQIHLCGAAPALGSHREFCPLGGNRLGAVSRLFKTPRPGGGRRVDAARAPADGDPVYRGAGHLRDPAAAPAMDAYQGIQLRAGRHRLDEKRLWLLCAGPAYGYAPPGPFQHRREDERRGHDS